MNRIRRIPIAVIVAGVVGVVTIALFISQGGNDNGIAHTPIAEGAPALGAPDAPITIIEYSDFQCPFCRIFAHEIMPDLVSEFVDTGKARFEYRHFPVFGQFSTESALASACAHEQEAFWAYHDALFEKVDSLDVGDKNVETLVEIATSVGLDGSHFRDCIEEKRHESKVNSDFQEGRGLGVTGTPTFVINGRILVGAHPIETWREVLNQAAREGW